MGGQLGWPVGGSLPDTTFTTWLEKNLESLKTSPQERCEKTAVTPGARKEEKKINDDTRHFGGPFLALGYSHFLVGAFSLVSRS